MTAKELLPTQRVTQKGDTPSRELVEVIQRLVIDLNLASGTVASQAATITALDTRIDALEAKLAAIAAVTAPTGGATIDSQSRTAINAIRTAAT